MDELQFYLTIAGIMITAVLGVVTTLLLFILKGQREDIKEVKNTLGREIGEIKKKVSATESKVNCFDRKLAKVTTVMVMLMPEEARRLLKENSPLHFQHGDEIQKVEDAVTEFLDDA